MIKILYFLFIIRFRKLLSKDDYIAIFILMILYFCAAIISYMNYETLNNYLFILLIDIFIQHTNRTDLELLLLKKNYKLILFIEYLIYLMPFYIVFLLKWDFLILLVFLIFKIIMINLPKINFKTISYPFQLFNPYWHIHFRKYKLVFLFPVLSGLIFMSIKHSNENIIYFVFIGLTLIFCVPSFERECLDEIKRTPFDSKTYLIHQFKNSLINSLYLIIPIAIILSILLKWDMLFFLVGVVIITLTNILLKYTFFSNPFLQQIVFILFFLLSISLFGVPLLIVPYLYIKSIENLNTIKYANH